LSGIGFGVPIEAGIESHTSRRDLDLLQELLLGEILEQRRLAAPEDVDIRAGPFHSTKRP
jgi:hypothetical protein